MHTCQPCENPLKKTKLERNGPINFRFSKFLYTVLGMSDALGQRIALVRNEQNIQSQELAGRVNLSASAMSQIESGQRQIKAEELSLIASVLNISPLALLRPDSFAAKMPVAKRTADSASSQGNLMSYIRWLADVEEIIRKYSSKPDMTFHPMSVDFEVDWLQQSREMADRVNQVLLDGWRTGSAKLLNLKNAIEESLGIDVLFVESSEDDLLGAAITSAELPLIVINCSQAQPRALFTLAHELGHLLSGGDSTLVTDKSFSGRVNSVERFANAFAAEFLLPTAYVERIRPSYSNDVLFMAQLLSYSGVSWRTLVYRLHNLGLINASQRDQLIGMGPTTVEYVAAQQGLSISLINDMSTPNPEPSRWITGALILATRERELGIGPVSQLIQRSEEETENLVYAESFTPDFAGIELGEVNSVQHDEAFVDFPV